MAGGIDENDGEGGGERRRAPGRCQPRCRHIPGHLRACCQGPVNAAECREESKSARSAAVVVRRRRASRPFKTAQVRASLRKAREWLLDKERPFYVKQPRRRTRAALGSVRPSVSNLWYCRCGMSWVFLSLSPASNSEDRRAPGRAPGTSE